MTAMARYETASATSTSGATGNLGGPTAQRPSEALTLDELLAEPMVQQLMRRDRTDEATIRRLWQHIAASPPARQPRYGVACRKDHGPRVRTRSPGCYSKSPGCGAGAATKPCAPGFPG